MATIIDFSFYLSLTLGDYFYFKGTSVTFIDIFKVGSSFFLDRINIHVIQAVFVIL